MSLHCTRPATAPIPPSLFPSDHRNPDRVTPCPSLSSTCERSEMAPATSAPSRPSDHPPLCFRAGNIPPPPLPSPPATGNQPRPSLSLDYSHYISTSTKAPPPCPYPSSLEPPPPDRRPATSLTSVRLRLQQRHPTSPPLARPDLLLPPPGETPLRLLPHHSCSDFPPPSESGAVSLIESSPQDPQSTTPA